MALGAGDRWLLVWLFEFPLPIGCTAGHQRDAPAA